MTVIYIYLIFFLYGQTAFAAGLIFLTSTSILLSPRGTPFRGFKQGWGGIKTTKTQICDQYIVTSRKRQKRHKLIGNHIRAFDWYRFRWSLVSLNDHIVPPYAI